MDDRGEKFHRKGAYSESATLLFGTGEQVKQIFIDSDKVRLNNIYSADQQNKSCLPIQRNDLIILFGMGDSTV